MLDTAPVTEDVGSDADTLAALVTIPPRDALSIFTTDKAIDPWLERVREAIDAFLANPPDLSTAAGRRKYASMANKVAKAKSALEDRGKRLADEQKAIPKKIDACRRHIRETLDSWRDEVRQPLTDWEAAEEALKEQHKRALAEIALLAISDDSPASVLRDRLAQVEAVVVPEGEYAGEYAIAKDAAATKLRAAIPVRVRWEADQAELARLRAENEERQKREREEQLRREGEERARRAAVEAAEAERLAAEAKVEAERKAAERREAELRRQAEEAERRVAEAKERAERAEREAKERAEREVRERAEREAAEEAKRAADREHRATVNSRALRCFIDGGVDEATGKLVITMIASGKVPAITIRY